MSIFGVGGVIRTVTRTVAEKMSIKADSRTYFVHASADILAGMMIPQLDICGRLHGEFDYIHLFVKTQADLALQFLELKAHLGARGMLWVSWPKGHQLGTDLTLPSIISMGYSRGMVESTTRSINDMWSAIKFTRPKPGKTYHNSYGTLPGQG